MPTQRTSAGRLARGIFANLIGVATRFAVQLVTLPIFFAYWPSARVGSWMVLYAVPGYLALVGTGFAQAAGSTALAAWQTGKKEQARADFRAAWVISLIGTTTFALAFYLCGEWLASSMSHALSGVDQAEITPALGWLAIYVLATTQLSVLEIAYRVAGRYPGYTLLNSIAQMVDIAVIAATVMHSSSVAVLAMNLALARLCYVGLSILMAYRAAPHLFAGPADAMRGRIGLLWFPSLGFMFLPIVYALNLQGYVLLVGAFYGPLVLATFVATRTLTRLLDLVTNFAWALQFYEAGYLGEDRRDFLRRQMATMTAISLVIAIVSSLLLLCVGPWVQSAYTLGKTQFDPAVAVVLLIAATIRLVGSSPSAMIAAENRHTHAAASYLVGTIVSFAIAIGLASAGYPLPVVLGGLIVAELAQTVPGFIVGLRKLGMTPGGFTRSLFTRERLEDVAMLTRHLFGRR